jgi:hypothetical protein
LVYDFEEVKKFANRELLSKSNYIIEDHLLELYQDKKTKIDLENNSYDNELNNKLKVAL